MILNKNFSLMEFGVYLEPKVESQIKARIERLRDFAPNNAKIKLKMTMPFRKVRGELVIQSLESTFKASAKHDDPLSLFDLLEQDILNQLKAWKAKRFSPTSQKEAPQLIAAH